MPQSCKLRTTAKQKEEPNMKVARLVLKIVALSLSVAALTCAVVAYWNELVELFDYTKSKIQRRTCVSEYDDYEE